MALTLPFVPPVPTLPFTLPFGFKIDLSKVIQIPPSKEPGCGCKESQNCPCCIDGLLNCLILKGGHEGCSYVLSLNYKLFLVKWRDVPPRWPWTRKVWDIYQVMPHACGGCSSLRNLGYQWCWTDVINTIRHEVFAQWINGFAGPGGITVVTGTNFFEDNTLTAVGPATWFDGADPEVFELSGSTVVRWLDKSNHLTHATQTDPAARPTLASTVLNNLSVVDFAPGQFLDVGLKAQSDTHIFALMRFRGGGDTLGTVFAATGYESPFGGPDLKVVQAAGSTRGQPVSYIHPSTRAGVLTPVPLNTFTVVEFSETIGLEGVVQIGTNGTMLTVSSGNTAMDHWNPILQTGGQSIPLRASIGRANWGLVGPNTFDRLDGQIAELLVYPRVLAQGQRLQVHNALRAKWNLGPPIAG